MATENTSLFESDTSLNNCIAHSNYQLRGKINVEEFEDRLVFINEGNFIPETVERAAFLNKLYSSFEIVSFFCTLSNKNTVCKSKSPLL